MITVTGYVDGVAFTAQVDPDATPNDRTGIVTMCAPITAVADIAAARDRGEQHAFTTTGAPVPVTLDNPLGVLAGFHSVAEIVAVTGDLPDGYPGVGPRSQEPVDY